MLVQSYFVKERGMGLGDFIRGSIACKQLCDEYSIPFEMDFRHHPMGKYLKSNNTAAPIPIEEVVNLQNVGNMTSRILKSSLEELGPLRNLRKYDLGIYTNVWPIFKIPRRVSCSIRNNLEPTRECEMAIQSTLDGLKDYRVIHVRAGDILSFKTDIGDVMPHTQNDIIKNLSVIEKIKAQSNIPCLVMSDSFEIKQIIAERWGIKSTPSIPAHLTLETGNVLDTLVDFFILSRARAVYQFSVHHWGSGFSDSVNWLYNVPVVRHRL
jgi:hypothetical protein